MSMVLHRLSTLGFRYRLLSTILVLSTACAAGVGIYLRARAQTKETNTSKKSAPAPRVCAPADSQMIYIPLFELPEATGSEIVFNSRSPHTLDITPTFYTTDGQAIVGTTFQIKSAEIITTDVQSLIPAEHRNRKDWGGMSLSYFGGVLEFWAQLRLLGVGREHRSVDALFAVDRDKRSNTWDAVWHAPAHSLTILAIGNVSNSSVRTKVEFSDGDTREVQIQPFGTAFIRRRSEERKNRTASNFESESARVTQLDGAQGSVIMTGVVSSDDGEFVTSVRFYDTPNAVQQNLYSTNFTLKNTTPIITLKNTSNSSIRATHPSRCIRAFVHWRAMEQIQLNSLR
jgi:hypothetical protein